MPDIPLLSIRWQIDSVSTPPPGRRSVAEVAPDPHLAAVIGDRFEVEKEFRATSPQRRGAEPLLPLDVTIATEAGASYLLAVRQEASGALSFHAPKAGPERRGVGSTATGTPGTATFEIEFPEDVDEGTRRSILTKAIKGVVLKAAGKFSDLAVPWIGSEVESFIWKKKGLPLGWLQVTKETLASGQLQAADFSVIANPTDRCLLLLHGTFSNTAGFQALATTRGAGGRDFFSAVAPIYGNRIYAFNHFTVSQTAEKNASDLIAGLPKQATFDVITHSRGGLVLRNLVERQAALGADVAKFQLGQAVLVAAPNIGTPLATADRFDKLISWWTNILELFPENPASLTAEYIGESLTFIARHVVDALPGLEAMDMAGDPISVLNTKSAAPPAAAYSAIISNHRPQGALLARMLDLGIDGIFGMANDLVVPTAGAWKTEAHPSWVPGARIGCFEINLKSAASQDGVIHTTYFSQPETVDFLLETFLNQPLGLQPVDVDVNLPFFLRRSVSAALPVAASGVPQTAPSPGALMRDSQGFLPTALNEADNILQLFLISPDDHIPPEAAKVADGQTAILLATYRNARVVETIYLHRPRGAKTQPSAGAVPAVDAAGPPDDADTYHWNKIIGTNEQIKNYVDGKANAQPPTQEQLLDLGVNLFNAMLPGTVRRLYDVARIDRARATDRRRLDVVITSMINWVADKPWEFAYDPNRESFLATEAVNFTRNVLTAVPAEEFAPHPDKPLHMLVVVAQPVGMALLSAAEEEQVVRRGFQELEDLGLFTVEYMMRARIDQLHERLRNPNVDILHFIGHGTYQKDGEGKDDGYLVFESPDGSMQLISSESLRQVLCQRGIRLIFLNACETGMVGRTQLKFDFNRGVAPKLVAGGIPVLVANQYKVLDVSATEFAKHFYRWLALGSTVGDAAREARVAVNYSISGDTIDWAVPVVYARNPGRMIYTEEEKAKVGTSMKLASRITRPAFCKGFKGTKVGLWDVNHVLPQLDDFAARLNGLQTDFCFQSVEVSAPLGTWRRKVSDSGESGGYIDGREVASKLKDHVASLGVTRLICITVFALADDERQGLALWNEDQSQRISIVSGDLIFAHIDDPRTSLNRFLANMLVSALCGLEEHKNGPPDCPNDCPDSFKASDPKVRAAALITRYKLCPVCAAKLGKQADSIDKILAAW